MDEPIEQTAEERVAVNRIKYDAARDIARRHGRVHGLSVSDIVMDIGDIIVAEIRAAVAAEREACAEAAFNAPEGSTRRDIARIIRTRGASSTHAEPDSTAEERGWRLCGELVCGYPIPGARNCVMAPGHDDGIHDRK